MYKVSITESQRQNYQKLGGIMESWGWAVDMFGSPGMVGSILISNERWNFDTKLTFNFRDEADAMIFSLKWIGR